MDIMAAATATVPEVGMGATYGYGSDSYPYTIVAVSETFKTLTLQRDEVMVLEGQVGDGEATYVTMPNTEYPTVVFTLRKDGHYYPKGRTFARQRPLSIGHRRYYQDPSF